MNHTPLLEWIPNVSTGNENQVVAIERMFRKIPGVYVLHTDRGPEVNRTVFTVVGTLVGLREALLALMNWIDIHLDMGLHLGNHPRLGALDVSPYVILKGGHQKQVLEWIRRLAQEVAETYEFPIYLYEQSASLPGRINLAEIRRGEYEGLSQKLQDPIWKPDFGSIFNPRLGATVMGLRDYLIAYNVNIDTSDLSIARFISRQIRARSLSESRHRLPGVKAIGWYLEDTGICQVSTNITRTREVTPLDVFDHCKALCAQKGCRVTGSELIGLIPYHAVRAMQANRYSTTELAQYLGLDYCGVSDLQTRIIEYKVYLASEKSIFNEIFESR